jgi:23S rRNA (cytosine1962-C5)-methyltransferase
MKTEKKIMFANRLLKVHRHLGRQAKRQQVSCYRLYDHDLPEFPFCIEFYDQQLYVAEYKRRHSMTEEEHREWLEQCLAVISETLGVARDHLFLKLRQRKPGRGGQYQKLDQRKSEFVVQENGLFFIVNLSDYLDTGLFLDHRLTRERIRAEAKDRKVLNLFAYTGSFSVYAAAGGATEVVSADLSKTYLQWAGRNLLLNGFSDEQKYRLVHADVKQYLLQLPDGAFDLIIMDPPTFSNSKRMNDFLDIQQDHVSLLNECMRILTKGGRLYFSTNYRQFSLAKDKIQASSIKDITSQTTPFDFSGRLNRYCFQLLK